MLPERYCVAPSSYHRITDYPSDMRPALRLARKIAGKCHRASDEESAKLRGLVAPLSMRKRLYLRYVLMVFNPDLEAYATGKGAVWAVTTRLLNEAAAETFI